jgi:hypothetical protein
VKQENYEILVYELLVEACDYGCGKDDVSYFVFKGCPLHYPLLEKEERVGNPDIVQV